MKINDDQAIVLCYFIFASCAIKKCNDFPQNLKFIFNSDNIDLIEFLIKNKLEGNMLRLDDNNGYYI